MFALVCASSAPGSAGWTRVRLTVASLAGGLLLIAVFVLDERRAQ